MVHTTLCVCNLPARQNVKRLISPPSYIRTHSWAFQNNTPFLIAPLKVVAAVAEFLVGAWPPLDTYLFRCIAPAVLLKSEKGRRSTTESAQQPNCTPLGAALVIIIARSWTLRCLLPAPNNMMEDNKAFVSKIKQIVWKTQFHDTNEYFILLTWERWTYKDVYQLLRDKLCQKCVLALVRSPRVFKI